MATLNLDPIQVDTALAEEYLKKYNNFDDWPKPGQAWQFMDMKNIDKFILGKDQILLTNVKEPNRTCIVLGMQLAKKIEENERLFSQLEYLIRKTDAVDVKNNIKLLSQHLQCYDEFSPYLPGAVGIIMNEKTPLYSLGCVACCFNRRLVWECNIIYIVTTQKMAPLCRLFTELCAQVGWNIPLYFACDPEEFNKSLLAQVDKRQYLFIGGIEETIGAHEESGCTGVVTETADIDSALDAFINSTTLAPWKFHRIYVQESVYDEVKSALAWKGSRERVDSSTEAFATKGKVFVCDAFSVDVTSNVNGHVVLMEAYRTVKELRLLVAQREPPFLSVWATDAALSQEIAFSSHASRVWINEYADFDGPPRACLPIYDRIYPTYSRGRSHNDIKLSGPIAAWKKLTVNERADLIVKALQGHLSSDSDRFNQILIKIQELILNRNSDGFVSVSGNRICFGAEQHRGIAMIDVMIDNDVYDVINHIIRGDAVSFVLHEMGEEILREIRGLFESLLNAGVPVCEAFPDDLLANGRIPVISKKIKVVSTNFGTVFAN